MRACAGPRNRHGQQAWMDGCGFDPVAVSLRDVAELVADHCLRRSLPRLDRRLIESDQPHRRMQKEVLAELEGLVAGKVKYSRRFQRTGGEDDSRRRDTHRSPLALRVKIVSFYSGDASLGLHDFRCLEGGDDARS